MRSLIYQFLIPVAVVAVGSAIEALTGWWIFTILGFVAGVVLAAVFAQRALARLAQLQLIASRQFAPGRPGTVISWPEEGGDEIDEALHHAEAFLSSASARWAEESQRAELLSHVLDRMRDAVIEVDAHGVVIYGNSAATTIFGGRNPAGRSFIRVVQDHRLDAAVRRCLESGEDEQYTFEIRAERRIINALVVRISQYPKEVLVVLRDVTELHRLQNIRRDFIANVSHELQAPLWSIKTYADSVRDNQSDAAEVERLIAEIDDEIDSMTALVQDLLDISQLEKGSESLRYETVSPSAVATAAVDKMRQRADDAAVQLAITTDADLPDIHADGPRLRHALISLVTNAIDHTPAGGRVKIRVTEEAGETTFTVEDTGQGIPEDDLERIWERFFKSDRSRAEPGSGLGLAIVKHVALAHGGRVGVTSEVGRGSTFEITVPDGSDTTISRAS